MFHRRLSALALAVTSALAITTMTMSPSLATDTDHAQVTSSEQGKPDGKSTFIVSVEEGGGDQDARLADVKTRVREAITQTQPGASVEDVAEYRHVFEGFAIKAPESALEAIKGVRGVKTAVVDTGRTPVFYPEFHRGEGEEITNPAALTRADQASFQGKGHVVEVLDMGFDATHEAFAGTMDTASLRFKQADMASVTSQLGVGRGGAWVSEKIPFAYDYADRDTDLYEEYFYGPEDFTQHAHSTRVAALAAANGATYRGAAPEAQLVVAKVVSSYSRYAFDSNLLAALDDAMVLKPDTLIVSFLANRSISGDAALLYGQAYDRLADAGTTVVAPVGDAGRSSWRADQPDGGTIGEPAANSQVLSVTALSGSGAEVGSELYPWSYSSWGVTPDLRLKPEIAAPGGEVNSAIPDRSRLYRSMEGTGEAAAQVAGIAALVRQRVDTDPAFAGMSEQEKSGVVTKLLMGTAPPVVDDREKNGIFWSPRTVGAGMVDALAATTSPVYPTVVGAANPTRPKADLGDGMRGWTFQVRLTNVSDTARTYTLGGQALSEKIEGGYFQDRAINWAGAGIDLTFSSESVTVPATSSATVTVSVTPRAEFASYAAANSPKGTFVDGALTFTSTDGAPDLTVPYMGFYGSWGDSTIFDSPDYGASKLGTSAMTFHGLPLGQLNPFAEEDEMAIHTNDRQYYIISRSTQDNARTYATPGTVLLRDVDSLTYTYTNEAGQVVRSYEYASVPKSVASGSGRFYNVSTAEDSFDNKPWFDGYDAQGNELPDGTYTLTIEGTTAGPSPVTQQLTHPIRVDTHAPVFSNVAITGEGHERVLSYDIVDSSPIASCGFSWSADGHSFMECEQSYVGRRGEEGLLVYHVEVKLSELAQHSGTDRKVVYLQAWDWPVNKAVMEVPVTSQPLTKVSLSPESSSLVVGESVTLSVTRDPADAEEVNLVWSSSDEAVATVSQDGVVTAVGAGDATISVADPTQPSVVSASAVVHVEAPAPTSKAGVWKWDGRGWWYRYEDGSYPADVAVVIDGVTYRFDESGYMRTGWVKDRGVWYYHNASGAQVSGWVLSGVSWYYLDPGTGAMAMGWVQVGATWYYLSPATGAMHTGWLQEGGHWYYLQPASGAMATGWLRIWGTWYHFADNGQLIS